MWIKGGELERGHTTWLKCFNRTYHASRWNDKREQLVPWSNSRTYYFSNSWPHHILLEWPHMVKGVRITCDVQTMQAKAEINRLSKKHVKSNQLLQKGKPIPGSVHPTKPSPQNKQKNHRQLGQWLHMVRNFIVSYPLMRQLSKSW